jgi:hypothetical protein
MMFDELTAHMRDALTIGKTEFKTEVEMPPWV